MKPTTNPSTDSLRASLDASSCACGLENLAPPLLASSRTIEAAAIALAFSIVLAGALGILGGCKAPPSASDATAPRSASAATTPSAGSARADSSASTMDGWQRIVLQDLYGKKEHVGYLHQVSTLEDPVGKLFVTDLKQRVLGFIVEGSHACRYDSSADAARQLTDLGNLSVPNAIQRILGRQEAVSLEELIP